MEYEKQLTSPMKRGGARGGHAHHHSAKHRHRKNRKSKRRRHDSYQSSVGSASIGDADTTALANSTMSTETVSVSSLVSLSLATTLATVSTLESSVNLSLPSTGDGMNNNVNILSKSTPMVVSTCETMPAEYRQQLEEREEHETLNTGAAMLSNVSAVEERFERRNSKSSSPVKQSANLTLSGTTSSLGVSETGEPLLTPSAAITKVATDGAVAGGGDVVLGGAGVGALLLPRERATRDLRLELNSTTVLSSSSLSGSTCSSIMAGLSAGGMGIGGGRKRKISESNNSQKNKKFHRDAMDKIVSPVVPQPGAWKRPPRLAATGARKPTRRSTSISETDILSPADEAARPLSSDADLLRVDTPDFSKLETISEAGLASPLSTTSGATSVAAGEQESLMDTSAGDNSTTMPAEETQTSLSITAKSSANVSISSNVAIAQLTKMPHFRADGVKYQYGNYDRYVGLRHLNELVDVRLQVFQRHLELFQNKDILDIGCNVGHMTITVARNFAPKSILGIDIDRKLVARARHNLGLYVLIPPQGKPAKPRDVASTIVEKEEKPKVVVKEESGAASGSTEGKIKSETADANNTAKVASCKANSHATEASANRTKKTRRHKKSKHGLQQQQQQQHAHHQQQQQHQPQLQHHHHHHHHHHMHHHHHHSHYQQQQLQALHVPATDLFPVSFPLTYGGIPTAAAPSASVAASTTTAATNTADSHSVSESTNTPGHASNNTPASSGGAAVANRKRKNDFPRNVFFRHQNYVLEDEAQLANDTQQYDLILCLSVTKWIHLNFGDAGLKMAFKRMFNQLRPGGKLILEAQNWASYKKKKNLTPEIYNNYRNIEFFPNKFHEYLLSSEVGFSHSYTLGVPRHLSKGFCRPIQLYAKGDYTPNHVRWSDAYYPQTPFEAYRGIYATMPPRPAGLASYAMSSTRSQAYDTPHYTGGTSGPYSCRQTPMYQPIYNPLETDSYLPSYDMEYLNHMYVFASPLYQTVWSPPASLRNSSSHTPVFGSVREAELDGDGGGSGGGGSYHRHVYPPNEDTSSPNANTGGAFSSIRDADTDDSNQLPAGRMQHVYATNCGESSSSPQVQHNNDSDALVEECLSLDDEQPVSGQSQGHVVAAAAGGSAYVVGMSNGELPVAAGSGATGQEGSQHYCDLNDA
ncbi:unnamed protein product [Ceratitis capitata]|nr:unnamed protein product [Ceratitis capitata]